VARSLSPGSLARRSARRPWVTICIWGLAVLIALGLVATLMGDALDTDSGPTGNPESEQAWDLWNERSFVPGESQRTEILLVRSPDRTVEDPVFQEFVEGLFADISGLGPEVIAQGTHFYQSGDRALVSLDRHTTSLVFTVVLSEKFGQYWDVYEQRGENQWHYPADALDPDRDKGEFRIHSFSAGGGSEVVIVRSPNLTVDDDEYRQFTEDLFYDLVALGRSVVWAGTYYYSYGDESLVSEDRHATIIPFDVNDDDAVGLVHAVVENARLSGEYDVSITGDATMDEEFNELSAHDLKEGELMFGLPIAIGVLILVFGALAAAGIPLVVSIVSIIVAMGLSMIFAQFLNISVFLVNMVFMMGLAVGIDYCLFIIARFREERAHGREKHDAIARAGATASQAVLFSGITVFLALIALLLVRHDIFISLGLGAVLVVLVTIAASLTLLPAMLSLLGDRVNSLRIPFIYRIQAKSDEQSAGGMWDRISRAVMRRPVVSILLGGGLLLAAAVPVLDVDIGTAGVSTIPDRFESKRGFVALERDFSAGLVEPAVIIVDGAIDSPEVQRGIDLLEAALAEDDAFGSVSREINPQGDLVKLTWRWAEATPPAKLREPLWSACEKTTSQRHSPAFRRGCW